MSSMGRSASAPLHTRSRSRYSSVLESALVGLGREDAVVRSTRKPRKKRRYDDSHSPIRGLAQSFSAPEQRSQAAAEEEEDPFACLKLLKSQKKNKKRREETRKSDEKAASPAVTRSASKLKKRLKRRHAGVLEIAGHTPVTRSMAMKKAKRSSLEMIEDVEQEPEDGDVVIQKKLLFSPQPQKKAKKEKQTKQKVESKASNEKEGRKVSRKAVVLKNWRVMWPPMLEPDSERMEVIVMGQVEKESALFVVGKRESASKFTAKDGTYVALSGKLDRDAARSAGIPRAAMRLMEDGIPAFFYKRLLPFVQNLQKTDKRKSVTVRKLPEKKARAADKLSSPMLSISEDADLTIEEPVASLPSEIDDLYETPKPKKAHPPAKEKKKNAKTNQPEPETEPDAWTKEQLEALTDAKLQIPTTASNFWAQVLDQLLRFLLVIRLSLMNFCCRWLNTFPESRHKIVKRKRSSSLDLRLQSGNQRRNHSSEQIQTPPPLYQPRSRAQAQTNLRSKYASSWKSTRRNMSTTYSIRPRPKRVCQSYPSLTRSSHRI
ncbi:hypothetical protein, variant [Phytophthora nicotianae P1976]|uniref:SANTA domain-containing protein n=1 Tax=Phytophthora nicotianae P1976 TaxID=1317066 RepID=A0A080Z342_PHYNI|nr:hypothetical protein, variant [Phytophthora nicotianae P1976]